MLQGHPAPPSERPRRWQYPVAAAIILLLAGLGYCTGLPADRADRGVRVDRLRNTTEPAPAADPAAPPPPAERP